MAKKLKAATRTAVKIDTEMTQPVDDLAIRPSSLAYGGSKDHYFNICVYLDALQSIWAPNSDTPAAIELREKAKGVAIAGLTGIAPKNELEGMIAAQIVAAYAASMECYRRAAISDESPEVRKVHLELAAKASKVFGSLTESLMRLRGDFGKQAVHIYHHTDARTQISAEAAVVNVHRAGEGGDEI